MSAKQARECTKKLGIDEAFRARVLAARDETARMELINAEGFDYSAEELRRLQGLARAMLDATIGVAGGGPEQCLACAEGIRIGCDGVDGLCHGSRMVTPPADLRPPRPPAPPSARSGGRSARS